jgi:DNA polymerase-1
MKFIDYSIISWLTHSRGKHDFVSYIERELSINIDDNPITRVYYLDQIIKKSQDTLDESQIIRLEWELLPVLAHMEYTWVALDREKLREIGNRIRRDIERTESEIYEVVWERFNIASPKQIQELFVRLGIPLTKKNKTGYSVDIEVLEEIAKTYDIARLILEHRSLAKLESTYVVSLLRSYNSLTGRIHTTYDSLGASTGRMSSNDPNLQNIPTGDGYANEIKSCFIPSSPDNVLLVADYSQIELRILAFLSQDENLLDAFKNGEDIHMRTARFLFPSSETISSHERRIAKSVNFWVIYGITGFGLSKTLGCTPWEANAYIDAFYEKYPGVQRYYDTLLEEGREKWYVETYYGRRRYIPGLRDANKTIRSISEREAMNMPVQWTAADILKIAMIDIDWKIQKMNLNWKMILQVHDELVFDVPDTEKVIFERIVRESMEWVLTETAKGNNWQEMTTIHNVQYPPITVDIHTGSNWSAAKG